MSPPLVSCLIFIFIFGHKRGGCVGGGGGGGGGQFQRLPRAPLFLDTPLMQRHVLEQGSGSKPPEALGPWKWPYVIGIQFSKHN